MFVIINKDGVKVNADVNAKNSLTKEFVTKGLFGFLVTVNVINDVILGRKLKWLWKLLV